MSQRRTTRRTALAGLGALGLVTTASACSLLPGLGGGDEEAETSPSAEGDGGASDGGGEPAEEPPAEPGTTFEGWASEEDLDLVELDTAAADAEFGTEKGSLEREDRYGTWWSPGFPEDSPIFTAEPRSIDERAEEAFGGHEQVVGAATGVLVQAILEIFDTPLLLEADNSRSDEVGAALVKAFGLEGYDESAFDELFAAVPVSGASGPDTGVPEMYDLEPLEYPQDGPRMRILEAVTEVERLDSAEFSGILFLASVRGALPVRASGEERPLVRAVSYGLGFSEDGGHVLMVYSVNSAPSVHIEDPSSLPVVVGTAAGEDWREHTVRSLTLQLPPDLGEPAVTEVGIVFQGGRRRGSVMRAGFPVPSPYPLAARDHVAQVEVPGADLAVVAVGPGLDSMLSVQVLIHREQEYFSVQIHDLTEEEAPTVVHQLLAGLRLES